MKDADEPQENDDRDRDSNQPEKNAAHDFTSILTSPKRQPGDEVPFFRCGHLFAHMAGALSLGLTADEGVACWPTHARSGSKRRGV
jgi:hypothetical protein